MWPVNSDDCWPPSCNLFPQVWTGWGVLKWKWPGTFCSTSGVLSPFPSQPHMRANTKLCGVAWEGENVPHESRTSQHSPRVQHGGELRVRTQSARPAPPAFKPCGGKEDPATPECPAALQGCNPLRALSSTHSLTRSLPVLRIPRGGSGPPARGRSFSRHQIGRDQSPPGCGAGRGGANRTGPCDLEQAGR